jgi:hypothetical protein
VCRVCIYFATKLGILDLLGTVTAPRAEGHLDVCAWT